MAAIYMITNTLNGKRYIGYTNQPVEVRMRQHNHPSSQCPAIRDAIKKHGWESFSWMILEESPDTNFLRNIREPFYISKYKPEYNLTIGGDGSPGNHCPRPTIKVGVIQYDHQGNAIREWSSAKEAGISLNIPPSSITHVCRQDHSSNFAGGFRWGYSSEKNKPLPKVNRIMNKRKVIHVNSGKVFDSLTEAANHMGCSKPKIVKMCKKGIDWKYL